MRPNLLRLEKLRGVFGEEADDVAYVEEFVAVNLGSWFAALGREDVSQPLLLIDQ